MLEGLVFLAVFISVRRYTGGYHSDSMLGCNLTLCICYASMLLLCELTADFINEKNCLLIFAAEIIEILIVSPVENSRKPIESKKKLKKYKAAGTVLFIVCGGIGIFLLNNSRRIGITVLYTLHVIVVLTVVGMIKEKIKRERRKA